MANIDGLPVNSAVTHAEFMSRTENTSTTGIVDFNNATDSTASTNGSVHVVGGAGIEKSLNVGINASVGGELTVSGETTLNDTLNASTILSPLIQADQIDSPVGNISIVNADTLNLTNALSVPSITVTNDAIVGGNLTVNGTTTTVNSTNLNVTDKNILINNGGNDATSEGAGLTVDRTVTDGSLIYKDASSTKWAAGAIGAEVDLVGTTSTQTLTNKTISGSNNTITNIAAANLTGSVSIANGGTGQTTQAAAFDALSPLTTKGDLVVNDGTNDIRLPVGTNNFVLTADSTQASGVKWAASSGGAASKTVGAFITSGGSVFNESENFINGNAVYAGGNCTITLNTFFSTISSVQCTLYGNVTGGTLGLISVSSATTATILVHTSTPGSGNINRDFFITVTGT